MLVLIKSLDPLISPLLTTMSGELRTDSSLAMDPNVMEIVALLWKNVTHNLEISGKINAGSVLMVSYSITDVASVNAVPINSTSIEFVCAFKDLLEKGKTASRKKPAEPIKSGMMLTSNVCATQAPSIGTLNVGCALLEHSLMLPRAAVTV